MARVYRVTIMAKRGSTLIEPSLHYQTDVPGLGEEPDPNDVANGAWSVWGTQFLACCASDLHVDTVVALEETLPPDIGVAGVHTVNLNGTHSLGDEAMPSGMASLINIHTGTRSRSARGWLRMPYPPGSFNVNGDVWTSTYQSLLQAFADLLDNSFELGSVNPTTVNPVVYSKTRRQRAETPYTFRVTNATANPRVHWLRSRTTSP